MKVVHISPVSFGDQGLFGGGERYPASLAAAMAPLADTTLVTFGTRSRRFRQGALEVRVLPTRGTYRGNQLNPLSELLVPVVANADVVHVHQWESVVANLAVALGRATRTQVYATDHGGSAPNYWRRLRLGHILAGFLPVSRFAAGFYPEFAAKTTVILGGAEPRTTRIPGFHERQRRVIFVGRLLPHKGVNRVIASLPAGVALSVVGRAYDEDYASSLRRLAAGKQVEFFESVSDAELAGHWDTARAVVLPSLHHPDTGPAAPRAELLGLTLIEGMAAGLPAICTRTGGMPEVVAHGRTGFVVDPDDSADMSNAITALVDDEPRWQQMSTAAARSVQDEFNWSATAQRCLGAYRGTSPGRGQVEVPDHRHLR